MTGLRRRIVPPLLVIAALLLSYGTISNQIKVSAVNAKFRAQARAGARGLERQCQLLPAGRKIQADALRRGVISADDYELYQSTAALYCPGR